MAESTNTTPVGVAPAAPVASPEQLTPASFIPKEVAVEFASKRYEDLAQLPEENYNKLISHVRKMNPVKGIEFLNNAKKYISKAAYDAAHPEEGKDPAPISQTPAKKEPSENKKVAKGIDTLDSLGFGDKKTEAPAATPEENAIDLDKLTEPDEKSKFKADWDLLKQAAKKAREAEANLKNQLKEAQEKQSSLVPNKELEEAKAKLKEANDRLFAFDMENSPEFKEKVVLPQTSAKEAMQQIITETGVEFDLEHALVLSGKDSRAAFGELFSTLDDFSKAEFMKHLSSYRQTKEIGRALVEKSKELVEQNKTRVSSQHKEAFQKALQDNPVVFKPLPVDPQNNDPTIASYNDALAGIPKVAEELALGKTSYVEIGKTAVDAAQYRFLVSQAIPRMVNQTKALLLEKDARIAELEKEVRGISKAGNPNPSAGGSGDENSSQVLPRGSADERRMSFAQKIAEANAKR